MLFLLLLLSSLTAMVMTNGGCIDYPPSSSGSTGQGAQVGNTAPDFKLSSMTGDEIVLSTLKGKKILLNFWASWCGPCQVEAPHIQEAYTHFNENNDEIVVLTVVLAFNDDPENVKKFIEKFHMTVPVLLDMDGKTAQSYGTNFIPVTYFIDTQGVIQSIKFGSFYSLDEINQHLKELD